MKETATLRMQVILLFALIASCMAILPAVAHADPTPVRSFHISGVTSPDIGMTPSWDYTVDDKYLEKLPEPNLVNCAWYESSTQTTNYETIMLNSKRYSKGENFTFQEGKYYAFVAYMEIKDGYTIADVDDLYGSINGRAAYVKQFEADGKQRVAVYRQFVRLSTDYVNTVDISGVTAPKAGASPSWKFTLPDNVDYKDEQYGPTSTDTSFWCLSDYAPEKWADIEDYSDIYFESGTGDEKLEKFTHNKYVTFCVKLKIKTGADAYKFNENATVLINGKFAKVGETANSNEIFVWYCFGQPTSTIQELDFNSVTIPVVGNAPVWNYSVAYWAPAQKATINGTDTSAWVETDKKPVTYADVQGGTWYYESDSEKLSSFKEGKYYTFVAWQEPEDGWVIDESTTTNFGDLEHNEGTIEFEPGSSGPDITAWFCYGKAKKLITRVDISGPGAPAAGIAPSWDFTISANSHCKFIDYPSIGTVIGWTWTPKDITTYENESELHNDMINYFKDVTTDGNMEPITDKTLSEFKYGDFYTLTLYLEANEGYLFADDEDLQIFVNGSLCEMSEGVNETALCWKLYPATSVPPITSVELAETFVTYDGKAKTPAVTVKNKAGKILTEGTDYILTYKNNVAVGIAEVIVEGIGSYTGTVTEHFAIIAPTKSIVSNNKKTSGKVILDTSLPKTKIKKLKGMKKRVKVKWAKKSAKKINGYQIRISTSKKFKKSKTRTVTVRKAKKSSTKIGKLKKKKRYYVQIRTFKKVNGKTKVSAWSKTKKVKTK